NPYLDPAEQEALKKRLSEARNEGLFTPQSLKEVIQTPGQLGGSNWGGTAGDPETGMLYVRAVDAPSSSKMSARQNARAGENATPAQRGRALYAQNCETCHGADRTNIPSPATIGDEAFKTKV